MKTHNKDTESLESILDELGEPDAYKIVSKPSHHVHSIYLGDNVNSDSCDYIDLLYFLDNVPEKDEIVFHLANFGGACHSGLRIAHCINKCKAKIKVFVEAPCYSMGAILALTGDELEMRPGTFLMFHNYSTLEAGKAGEVKAAVDAYQKHFEHSVKYFCAPFLTPQEIKKLNQDKDIYIHADDKTLSKRCERHFGDNNKNG